MTVSSKKELRLCLKCKQRLGRFTIELPARLCNAILDDLHQLANGKRLL